MSSKITGSYSAWCAVGCAEKKVQDEFQEYRGVIAPGALQGTLKKVQDELKNIG